MISPTPSMHAEIRRIAYARFGPEYWPSIEAVLESYSPQHSRVICTPNKEKSLAASRVGPGECRQVQSLDSLTALKFSRLAAFVLVCAPSSSSHSNYGLEGILPNSFYEVAFLATDVGQEGRGYARQLLTEVLRTCQDFNQHVWLHVDLTNPRATSLYQSLGFQTALTIPDPFGSMGHLMVWLSTERWNQHPRERLTLFDTSPCQTEQSFGGSILPPPGATCY